MAKSMKMSVKAVGAAPAVKAVMKKMSMKKAAMKKTAMKKMSMKKK